VICAPRLGCVHGRRELSDLQKLTSEQATFTKLRDIPFMFEGFNGARAQNRAMAMPKRFRLSVHVALTLISFVTTGRAPRLLAFGARDLATVEKRTGPIPVRQFF
jgi:hypothetical protein